MVMLAKSVLNRTGTKGVGIALGLAELGGMGWADLTARISDAGIGRVSIIKLGMTGQCWLFLKSSNSPSVTEIKSWAECPLRSW